MRIDQALFCLKTYEHAISNRFVMQDLSFTAFPLNCFVVNRSINI